MTRKKVPITLYGSKAEKFEEIEEELEERLPYSPTRPEVVGRLMERWESE